MRGHNLQANHGRIEDAHFATVTAYLAKSQIFQKVSAGTGQRLKEKRAKPAARISTTQSNKEKPSSAGFFRFQGFFTNPVKNIIKSDV